MCTSPVTIRRRLPNYDAPLKVARLQRYGLNPFACDEVTVPCGHCIECLKKRQNDLAIRCIREAERRGSMHFVTLTYEDKYLPLSCSLEVINKDTGEIITSSPNPLVRYRGRFSKKKLESDFVAQVRAGVVNLPTGSISRKYRIPCDFENIDSSCEYHYIITPSLNRRDVRLWLKSGRLAYEREYGCKLPEFSYVVVGELGPKTCRPHYHVCFFGLDTKQVSWLVNRWQFGYINNIKSVNAVNPDGTNGFQIASRYIGKYMTKGRFDCDSVKDRLCERPRLMASLGLGKYMSEPLISYFRAYDLFGEYDIDSCKFKADGSYLTKSQLSYIKAEVLKRSYFTFGGQKFALPAVILKSLWYVKSEKNDGSYRASTVRTFISDSLRFDSLENFVRKSREVGSYENSEDFSRSVSEFVFLEENNAKINDSFQESSLRSFYARSIF